MSSHRRLLRPVSFKGTGLHTGETSEVVVSPLPSGSPPELEIGDDGELLELCIISGEGRGTTVQLPRSRRRVRTPEHLFAALHALGLWSVRITLQGSEVPAADGSAELFFRALFDASCAEPIGSTEAPRKSFSPASPLVVADERRGSMLSLFPWKTLSITYVIQYEDRLIGTQMVEYDASNDDFYSCIARARTFGLASEVRRLRDAGLARGGNLGNALVVDDGVLLSEEKLRFSDEFVRHKVLDLLGDLYLLGAPLNARITAVRAGHAVHCRLVERLRKLRGGRHYPAEFAQ